MKTQRGVKVKSYSFFNLGRRWRMGSYRLAPAVLCQGMTRYPLYRRLGGLHGRSIRVWKIAHPPGFDPQNVEFVASSYTDHSIQADTITVMWIILFLNLLSF